VRRLPAATACCSVDALSVRGETDIRDRATCARLELGE
jgi:hypothetical protein